MTKTKTISKATTERLHIIRNLVAARRALLRLAVETEDAEQSRQLGEAEDALGSILASIRKPLQPTPHTHGPLPQE